MLEKYLELCQEDALKIFNKKEFKKINCVACESSNLGEEFIKNSFKNISLILMNFENQIMDLVRGELIKNKIKFISMFDGFIVKKQYSNLTHTICNELLKRVDSSLKFMYNGKRSS